MTCPDLTRNNCQNVHNECATTDKARFSVRWLKAFGGEVRKPKGGLFKLPPARNRVKRCLQVIVNIREPHTTTTTAAAGRGLDWLRWTSVTQARSQDFAQEGATGHFSAMRDFEPDSFHGTPTDVMLKFGRISFYLVRTESGRAMAPWPSPLLCHWRHGTLHHAVTGQSSPALPGLSPLPVTLPALTHSHPAACGPVVSCSHAASKPTIADRPCSPAPSPWCRQLFSPNRSGGEARAAKRAYPVWSDCILEPNVLPTLHYLCDQWRRNRRGRGGSCLFGSQARWAVPPAGPRPGPVREKAFYVDGVVIKSNHQRLSRYMLSVHFPFKSMCI